MRQPPPPGQNSIGTGGQNSVGANKLEPTARKSLDELDSQYRQFVPLRKAAAKGDLLQPDAYSPKVLLRTIREGDAARSKRGYIGGELPQQELATAAERVLGSKVPDSGTAERALVGAGLGFGAAVTGIAPHTLAAMTGARIYAMPIAQRFLTGQNIPQKAFEQWWDSASPQLRQGFLMQMANLGRATGQQMGGQ